MCFGESEKLSRGPSAGCLCFGKELFRKVTSGSRLSPLSNDDRGGRTGVAALQSLDSVWNTAHICGLKSLAIAEIVFRISAMDR